MFHMLSCFNLKPAGTVDEFCRSVADFTAHLKKIDLVQSTGPVGRRQTDTIMDTDSERDHEYFFIMTFRDRAQCDRAVEHIYALTEPEDAVHKTVYAMIDDPVFICWEDVRPEDRFAETEEKEL